jgi:NADH-quinone oxidoreductase subunit A
MLNKRSFRNSKCTRFSGLTRRASDILQAIGFIDVSFFDLHSQYKVMLVFISISICIVVILFTVSAMLSQKTTDYEKTTPYECGFEPFGDMRLVFTVQFYIVAILFLIFDLELAFLFPWAANLALLNIWSFWLVVFGFLGVLTLGFVFEWKKGALDWA